MPDFLIRPFGTSFYSQGGSLGIINIPSPTPASTGSYPTFSSITQTDWGTNTNPKTTPSFSVNNGDYLVAFSIIENAGSTGSIELSNSGQFNWNKVHEYGGGLLSVPYQTAWTGIATGTNPSATVTFNRVNSVPDYYFGGIVYVIGNSTGIGNISVGDSNEFSTDPSLSVTGSKLSAMLMSIGDWNALSTAPVWISGIGEVIEDTVYGDDTTYGAHNAHAPQMPTGGIFTVGMTSPTNQRWTMVTIEVFGTE